jgi:uncharacterized NAD(P)/FAD-binding protein YdhS
METCEIAIVGGGCSGLLVAVQLLRQGFTGAIAIAETRSRLGRGLAYSTPFDEHLLNVPAAKMSALPDAPAHFLEWLRARQDPAVMPGWFAPRRLYGEYLEDLLRVQRAAAPGVPFEHIRAEVTGIDLSGTPLLVLHNGGRLQAGRVVLALGNPAASPGVGVSRAGLEDRWHLSPWIGDALRVRFPHERILLLGTGLTAVDAALALTSQKTPCRIYMLSRRGLCPQAHDAGGAAGAPPVFGQPQNLRGMLRQVRHEIRAAADADRCWRTVIDGLRPVSNQLWQELPVSEQIRFQRHLRTFWETHRHRMAPEVRARFDRCRDRGILEMLAGRIHETPRHGGAIELRIALRGGGERRLEVDRIVNCTGLHENYRDSPRRLVRSLIGQGAATANALGTGFRADGHGALCDVEGRPSAQLFTLGPPRRGELFETTAVPEIRAQAEALARHLIATAGQD